MEVRPITDVWHGRGRVTGGGFTYTVVAGQSATFTGNEQHLDYDLSQIPDRDGFDDWAFERDDREDRADSANYVSREMTGYEDLDEYGDWSYVAGYGPCWRPRAVVVGWAPYRFGHWVYVGPWGWTWVEDEPWGFAPFHYGRWALVSGGWFWVPGPVVIRPVWAPAMVAFVGGGPGFHFSAGVGVGWFPLAPGEVYVPGYRVSRAYVNNVNITNTTVNVTKVTNVYNTVIVNKSTTINNITYVNQHVNNGVTVVSHDAFVNARPVAQNIMRVDPKEMASAPVSHVVAVEPVRSSVIGAGRPAPVKPPAAVHQPSGGGSTDTAASAAPDRAAPGAGGWAPEWAGVGSSGGARAARPDQSGRPAGGGRFQTVYSVEQRQQESGEGTATGAAAGLRAAGNSAAGKPAGAAAREPERAAAGESQYPACEPRIPSTATGTDQAADPGDASVSAANAAGAGAQPATGAAAGTEVQSMAASSGPLLRHRRTEAGAAAAPSKQDKPSKKGH